MDSKGKKIGILLVLCAVLVVMAAVVVVNFNAFMGKGKPAANITAPEPSGQILEADGKVKGANLTAFLQDEDFFDAETSNSSNGSQGTYDEVDENGAVIRTLTLLASSVERDIRVKVVDDRGNVVSGHEFLVEVEDTGAYIDEDKDGIIRIPDLKPGDYRVSLHEQTGFQVPSEPAKVSVKSIVSYTTIDDISYFVHSEADVDILKDDTAHNEAVDEEDEDDSQYKALWEMEERDNAVSLGIDVSKWNGEIDWDVVKAEGVDFAIIRCGYRGSSSGWLVEDPYFFQNIQGAKRAGIKVGVYFFTQAIDLVEAVEEASMVITLLGDTKLDFPIFIDTEGANGGRADNLDAATRTAVVNAFCQTIQNAGLEAGVYASRNWYLNRLNIDDLYGYKIWLAEYRETPLYEGNYDLWQYTSSGSVAGIEGRVDLNVSYLGY